ncbi:hypothetical protein WJ32_08285 [Burkholderia ubonensis]|uniref:Uncharacterized protein n=1 Tax=Burkholderia ubonensis TaxID=101571 RepID=A0A118HLK6_9BURK|nr:hypothetical protein WJ32_08285 [Burkholderia ubonensis]KVG56418.1 hypothetical protein WJ33_36950 [Burkholderia ubonensis]
MDMTCSSVSRDAEFFEPTQDRFRATMSFELSRFDPGSRCAGLMHIGTSQRCRIRRSSMLVRGTP